MNFGHIVTAMVTPFDSKGNIDFNKTTKVIEHLIANGSDGLVVAGTTGESPTLSQEEKLALFEHAVKVAGGRVKIIAGTGSNNTFQTVEFTKRAEQTGVDAVMLVTPYYNKPSQQGMFEHFKTIAEKTKLPVMLYNVPGRTGTSMHTDTVVELSKIDNIVSVKEASGDLDQITDIIYKTPEDFTVYSGDDGLTLPIMSIGGDGVVSVASHVLGNEMQEMINAHLNGKHKEASKLHQKLLPVMNGLFAAPNPVPVKTALQLKGLDTGGVRLPLIPLTSEERHKLSDVLNTI
ncbi:4-hydroxy-tetrahydrodipicolinate synthase [Alteribacter keqinensis]|uniref:4-hydroxy-tetrahydrodipicolinate synthase n=1 Tax=Alteribacter keqinensis TaxID=2483800 RepID=A0A3M7TYN4_9BACI|nr:4-hydroxy-tetrahydrodipicolinate synthase [Alteribacter keqinensis]RNA69535.1 4-hydroxy-tetrahydrodipicolinate synthase [Alteribacter keqinensis]